MALKTAHKLAGNLDVPNAYFRITAYRVTREPATVTASVAMYASPETRAAFKAAQARSAAIPGEHKEAVKKWEGVPAEEIRAKSDAKLAVMLLENEKTKTDEAMALNRAALETDVVIEGEAAAAIIGKHGEVKLGDIYGALKAGALKGAEDFD